MTASSLRNGFAVIAGGASILRESRRMAEGANPRGPHGSKRARGAPYHEGCLAAISIGLDQRAAALVERTESFVAGDGCEQLVEIPLALRLLGLLDLEQIHVVDHAAVDPDLAALGE